MLSDLVVVCKAHLVLPQSLYSSSQGKTGTYVAGNKNVINNSDTNPHIAVRLFLQKDTWQNPIKM